MVQSKFGSSAGGADYYGETSHWHIFKCTNKKTTTEILKRLKFSNGSVNVRFICGWCWPLWRAQTKWPRPKVSRTNLKNWHISTVQKKKNNAKNKSTEILERFNILKWFGQFWSWLEIFKRHSIWVGLKLYTKFPVPKSIARTIYSEILKQFKFSNGSVKLIVDIKYLKGLL